MGKTKAKTFHSLKDAAQSLISTSIFQALLTILKRDLQASAAHLSLSSLFLITQEERDGAINEWQELKSFLATQRA